MLSYGYQPKIAARSSPKGPTAAKLPNRSVSSRAVLYFKPQYSSYKAHRACASRSRFSPFVVLSSCMYL